MIAFIIWSIVAILFLGIGISARKSKEAVGFFTFIKPPVITDIIKYNRSVSMLWIIAAIILEILGIPLLIYEQNSPVFIFVTFGVIALVLGMLIAYFRIQTKYQS